MCTVDEQVSCAHNRVYSSRCDKCLTQFIIAEGNGRLNMLSFNFESVRRIVAIDLCIISQSLNVIALS